MIIWRSSLLSVSVLYLFFVPSFGQSQTAGASITLAVDATEASRKILHARETLLVKPGPLTLLYPKWIPGEHGPSGPITDFVGLKATVERRPVPWRRDLDNMYAIKLELPAGSHQLDLTFDFILSPETRGFSSGASSSEKLVIINWNQVVLYPAGQKPDGIIIAPSLTLPAGWKYATPLKAKEQTGTVINFTPVSLTMLMDSPVLSGVVFRRIDVTPPSGPPHFINIAADNEIDLEMTTQQLEAYKRLVTEALALFRAHHYEHYDFLYTLSDHVAHFGLEHHQSSDNRVDGRTLIDPELSKIHAGLLPHEFVHSWNGKFRRPTGLATGDFSSPMRGDLLWVYEGLTQYLGELLTARSGLLTPDEFREVVALIAARLDNRPGRTWRPLQDTADAAQLLYGTPDAWSSWRRGTDFYDESLLIWLEADVTIRQLTEGKKSLDDFCRAFHGGESGKVSVKPYTFEDVVATLNTIVSFDWKAFLQTRLQSLSEHAPLGGLTKSGWKLIYNETISSLQKAYEEARKFTDLRFSLGIIVKEDATLSDVIPESVAARAGLAPGMKLVAIDGQKYSKDTVRNILKARKTGNKPLELLVMNGDSYKTYKADYHGGDRNPHLERDPANSDLLGPIIQPLAR